MYPLLVLPVLVLVLLLISYHLTRVY